MVQRKLIQTEITYEQLPTKLVEMKDWAVICDRLEAGEAPVYEMTEKETRAFYLWTLNHRGYRITTKSLFPGIYKLSKGLK